MRILGVRFKNLNSLSGEWHIDFTHPEYASDGIFAITGPTGAGKTTILDAICLGLYGRTPRLDKVTKSSNEIMSRQTGECFAEVTFETLTGRYRCHWSQHRARKKPEGELRPAKHEVAEAASGTVLEVGIQPVAGFIEETTGMNFDRFTRSMLLAQGGFAAFLQAPPDERSPILEQITGTEIYSRISMKVHERRVEERTKLELLLAELSGIRVLSAEEEGLLQTDLKEKQSREAELDARLQTLRTAVAWLETVAALEKGLAELERHKHDHAKRRALFEPEGIRLDKARKALALEGDYRGVAAVRAQQAMEIKELDQAVTALPLKEQAREETAAGKTAAENALNEARNRQQSEAEVIKKVRELDARLSEQKKRLEEMDTALVETEKQGAAHAARFAAATEAWRNAQADLKTVHGYLSEHAPDAALVSQLSAISRVFAALRDIEDRNSRHQEALAAADKHRLSALAACQKSEAAYETSRTAFEKGQADLQALTGEIAAILKGREISQLYQEKNTLSERERILKQVGDAVARIDQTSSALNSLQKDLDTYTVGQGELLDAIKTCADQKTTLEGSVANLEIQVSLLSRIRDLEEERKRLEDSRPCPLCGALDHPYAKGNVPELNEAETALKHAKDELKRVTKKLATREAEHAKRLSEIRFTQQALEEKQATLAAHEKQCAEDLLRLNMQPTPSERAVKVGAEIAAVQNAMAEISGLVVRAEEKLRRAKAAQEVLEKLRVHGDDAGKSLQDARHAVETADREQARLRKEADDLGQELAQVRAAALKDVEPFGIKQIPSTDTLMQDLTTRRDTWQAKQAERTVLEQKIHGLQAGIEKDQALREKLEHDRQARRQEREDFMRRHDALGASRRELYGGKSTDAEEQRLAETMEQAGKALEKARAEYGAREQEIGALQATIEDLNRKTLQRAAALAQAEQRLRERIMQAGFTDEAGYVSACLDEKERERLTELEQALNREKTELDARWKDKSAALAVEREKRLTEHSLASVREGIDSTDTELKQIRIDLGGILGTLSENAKLHARQQERLRGIEAQKRDCARWDDLHQLIGSADGKKFRNFAQGLTFEMMTRHANRQLRKMTDRYLLIRDASQPLELNVIDNYQAGEIRSTKNLSGGESFIVSLALALGLSQMASRKVRVDSLFLDEGFGTLDEDALETALETLAGLRQDGKLIGVISHVTVLKERIGTQIQVIPETGGRSILTGPGCCKI